MKACATASGGVMFIPQKVERKPSTAVNDNAGEAEEAL